MLNHLFGLTALLRISQEARLSIWSRLRHNLNLSLLQTMLRLLFQYLQMLTHLFSKLMLELSHMYQPRTAWFGQLNSSLDAKSSLCALHSGSHQLKLKSVKNTVECLFSLSSKFLISQLVVFKFGTLRLLKSQDIRHYHGCGTSLKMATTRFGCSDQFEYKFLMCLNFNLDHIITSIISPLLK